jgi:arylsulfatase A-like enzyme
VDSTTITWNLDVLPTLCKLAKVPLPAAKIDGEDMSAAWLGKPQQRTDPLLWVYGYTGAFLKPGNPRYRSPDLAIRDGKWKLLVNDDGSDLQLYNLQKDIAESDNVAKQNAAVAKKLSSRVIGWWKSMPQ